MRVSRNFNSPPWTEEEKQFAVSQRLQSVPWAEIAAQLPGRTIQAVKLKVAYVLLTPEQKARRLETERRRYRSRVPSRDAETVSARPTDSQLNERNIRLTSAPRDLTALMMGDPPRGWSALDRKRGATT